jgi:hypothetical protein
MRRLIIGALTLALFGPVLAAQQDKDQPQPDKPGVAEYKALIAEIEKTGQEARKKYDAAEDPKEKEKIRDEFFKQREGFANKFLELAQKHAKEEVAAEVALMALNVAGDADREKVLDLMRTLIAKSPHKPVQAQLALSLAQDLKGRAERTGSIKMSQEAESLFERVIKDYPEAKNRRGEALAKSAEDQIAEMRKFGLGKEAPDIEGVDSDGKSFKLSDYKGKVVVLDFWAGW